MAAPEDVIGRTYDPVVYEVGAEKIREYAHAIGEQGAVHHDRGAAREAGFRDVVAPPMFCVVFSGRAVAPGLFDPEIGIDFARMVHGGQEFRWGEPVCAGDEITTTLRFKSVERRGGMGFFVFETESVNQDGAAVVTGTWTNIVRGVE